MSLHPLTQTPKGGQTSIGGRASYPDHKHWAGAAYRAIQSIGTLQTESHASLSLSYTKLFAFSKTMVSCLSVMVESDKVVCQHRRAGLSPIFACVS